MQRPTEWAESHQLVVKVPLAVVSTVLAISMGGQVLLPLLVPLHVWAARRSGPVGRALWSLPALVGAAVVTWAVVYVTLGEAQPLIWLAPAMVMLAAAVALAPVTRRNLSP